MATIIDSLVVKLGLDSNDFSSGKNKVDAGLKKTGEEASKTGAKLKKAGDDGAKGFDGAAKSAVKFFAVLGGVSAIKNFVADTIESSAALDRFSKNLGIGVSTVSAWSNAAELAGGSAAGLQGTLDMLSKAQTELQLTGQNGLVPYFAALGVAMNQPVSSQLMDLADRFGSMDRTKAFNLGQRMGIDADTMNFLLKSRAEIEKTIGNQEKFNALTAKQAEEASKLKLALTNLLQIFTALGRDLLSDVTPALEQVFSVFQGLGEWMRDNKEVVKNFLTTLAIGFAAVSVAAITISATAVTILSLAAALATLAQDYQTWKKGGDSFFGDDWKIIARGADLASVAVKKLSELLGDLIYRGVAAGGVVASIFSGDFKSAKFAAGEFMAGRPEQSVSGSASTVSGSLKSAMAYFQAQGWSKEQAAGLAANIQRESNFNVSALGDNSKAYGIGQWHPDRQAEFKKVFGKNIQGSSFEDQLAFMHYELTRGNERKAGNILRGTNSAFDAAAAVSTHYERPADKIGEAEKRGRLALAMLGGISGASQAAMGAGAGNIASSKMAGTSIAGNRSVETKIGEIKVYSAATDAEGIAKDIGNSIDYLFTSQANYGLN